MIILEIANIIMIFTCLIWKRIRGTKLNALVI